MVDNEGLSILIPTYNFACLQLVSNLHKQAMALTIPFEIIISDDASSDLDSIRQNKHINNLPFCKYILQPHNLGRASNRNFLANESKFSCLLFIDSDMTTLNDSYLASYWNHHTQDVVYGTQALIYRRETCAISLSIPAFYSHQQKFARKSRIITFMLLIS